MGLLLVGGFVSRRELSERHRATPAAVTPCFTLGRTPFAGGSIDLQVELRAMLSDLDAVAAGGLVRLELAVEPGLVARTDQGALRQIASDLVRSAIDQSAGGCVLVAAGRRSGAVQIAVVDDGAGQDRGAQEARLRMAERLAALQGATLEVTVRPNRGTTAVLRLPEPAASRIPGSPVEKMIEPVSARPPATRTAQARQFTP